MKTDNKTLADAQPGGRVRLGDRATQEMVDAGAAALLSYRKSGGDYTVHPTHAAEAAINAALSVRRCCGGDRCSGHSALSAQPSPGGQGDVLLESLVARWRNHAEEIGVSDNLLCQKIANCTMRHAAELQAALAARQPVGEQHADDLAVDAFAAAMKAKMAAARAKGRGGWEDPVQCTADGLSRMLRDHVEKGDPRDVANFCMMLHQRGESISARQPVGQTFQAGVAEWMGQCFLPSLYSNMTERGDRLLEEVLELLQAHGYDKARVPALIDYVFGRPVGDPAQEVGGVMVTLAGYCWVAGLDMHAAGDAELARINQPEVMAKIRAKQEAKNALHFDTPLPGDAGISAEEWPREGDLVRYGAGSSALAIRLGPHAGGWHGYQCCGGYTFFTKAYRPSRADMDTWLDCAKYRDERTKTADNRVAHEMYLIDHNAEAHRG